MDRPKSISRRRILAAGTAGIVGAALPIAGQNPDQAARPKVPADPTKVQGPLGHRRRRALAVRAARSACRSATGRTSSLTPLQDLDGIITPADLHFERHHGGVPAIDPQAVLAADPRHGRAAAGLHARRSAALPGQVDHPLRSNARATAAASIAAKATTTDLTPQQIDGLTSTSEWTGVPLATLLREVGASPKAHVVPRRRHGRRGDDAQHPDREGAGTTR